MQTNTPNMTTRRPTGVSSSGTPQATHFVLGGGHVGNAIAERLQTEGHAVTVIDEACDPDGVPVIEGSPADVELLAEAGLETARTVVVGTRSDARNFLIAQLVRAYFAVPRIVVLVRDPELLPSLAEAGHEALCVTTVLSETVGQRV